MNVKTNRKQSAKQQLTIHYCLWVREVMDGQQKTKRVRQQNDNSHPATAMQRHGIATNHL